MGYNQDNFYKALQNDAVASPQSAAYKNIFNTMNSQYGGNIDDPGFINWVGSNYGVKGTYNKFKSLYGAGLDGQTPTQGAVTPQVPQAPQSSVDGYNQQLSAVNNDISKATEATRGMSNYAYSQYMDTMKRLMEREERYGSGNPFIDMIESYAEYRKRRDPNYEFRGLMGMFRGKNGAVPQVNDALPQQFYGPQEEPKFLDYNRRD